MRMHTYNFDVVVEPDDGRWHAYCPALESLGAATWGNTRDEALRHIREVVQMVTEGLVEDGIPVPDSSHQVLVSRVAVTV